MNTIKLLSPLQINNNIDHILGQLQRADDLTLEAKDMEDDLLAGDYELYEFTQDGEWKYYLLSQVVGRSYFVLRVVGGSKLFPWKDFFKYAMPYIKAKDCVEIRFHGAKEWENKIKDLGFRIIEYVYKVDI